MTSHWQQHFKALSEKNLPAAVTLQKAVGLFEKEHLLPSKKTAIDLGCGTGIDTFFLLANGWQVTAIDKEAAAIDSILAQMPVNATDTLNLKTIVGLFEQITLSHATLINATFALPFCHPNHFHSVWQQIRTSLLPGARFAGQFFGFDDSWANRSHMTFHHRTDIDELFTGFRFDYFEETNQQGKTIKGADKRWHVYHIVARKL